MASTLSRCAIVCGVSLYIFRTCGRGGHIVDLLLVVLLLIILMLLLLAAFASLTLLLLLVLFVVILPHKRHVAGQSWRMLAKSVMQPSFLARSVQANFSLTLSAHTETAGPFTDNDDKDDDSKKEDEEELPLLLLSCDIIKHCSSAFSSQTSPPRSSTSVTADAASSPSREALPPLALKLAADDAPADNVGDEENKSPWTIALMLTFVSMRVAADTSGRTKIEEEEHTVKYNRLVVAATTTTDIGRGTFFLEVGHDER